MAPERLLRPVTLAAFILCFCVVVLGAYVRLNAAGLGCPDWPGCYGHFSPAGALAAADAAGGTLEGAVIEPGKAWKEMIHRYAASTLGLAIIAVAFLAWRSRRQQLVPPPLAFGLVALVVVQGLFGMLTVTRLLEPVYVTGHLLLGLATLSVLWWMVMTIPRRLHSAWHGQTAFLGAGLARTRLLVAAALAMLVLQIALGGWTSSHYAAIGCPDFPRCQGEWWPTLSAGSAAAIHFTHRLGALAATLLLVLAALRVLLSRQDAFARRAAWCVLGALALQLAIAVTMVLAGFPLLVATAHNAGAALLLLATLALLRSLMPAWKPS
jgi:cytochrome c oxidase assembly protein subunit 15